MKHLPLLTLAVLGLASCAQTGDPSSGGLFGWNENMYNQDMHRKATVLHDIQTDTDEQRAEAARLQRKVNSQ